MPVVPKSFSYAQKKYPSEARNKSGKQLISCNSKRQIIERTEKQNASSRYFNSSRAHHAAEGKFDEPIGSAGNRPQGGLCKPPARPVVMIMLENSQESHLPRIPWSCNPDACRCLRLWKCRYAPAIPECLSS